MTDGLWIVSTRVPMDMRLLCPDRSCWCLGHEPWEICQGRGPGTVYHLRRRHSCTFVGRKTSSKSMSRAAANSFDGFDGFDCFDRFDGVGVEVITKYRYSLRACTTSCRSIFVSWHVPTRLVNSTKLNPRSVPQVPSRRHFSAGLPSHEVVGLPALSPVRRWIGQTCLLACLSSLSNLA